jgi:hypothetical protein
MSPADQVLAIAGEIKPLLAGKDPSVQGAVLAELLSLWLAGHPSLAREALIETHVDHVRLLIPLSEKILFRGGRHPADELLAPRRPL